MDVLEPSEVVRETCLKSHLDVVFDQAKNRGQAHLKFLKEAEERGEDVKQKDRVFREKEIAQIQNLANLQNRVTAYMGKNAQHTPGMQKQKELETTKTNNSEILGLHLRAMGEFRFNRHFQAHHIICSKHPGHAASRLILFYNEMEMGINDPKNGVWLPRKHKYAIGTATPHAVGHAHIHTDKYAQWVFGIIKNSQNSKRQLVISLDRIKKALLKMDDKIANKVLTEPGKKDLQTHH